MKMTGSLRTATLALIGFLMGAAGFLAYESRSISRSFHFSQLLSTDGSNVAMAQCTDTGAQAASSDIFFVSCGGIY